MNEPHLQQEIDEWFTRITYRTISRTVYDCLSTGMQHSMLEQGWIVVDNGPAFLDWLEAEYDPEYE